MKDFWKKIRWYDLPILLITLLATNFGDHLAIRAHLPTVSLKWTWLVVGILYGVWFSGRKTTES